MRGAGAPGRGRLRRTASATNVVSRTKAAAPPKPAGSINRIVTGPPVPLAPSARPNPVRADGERFHHQTEGKTLVAEVEPAERQQCPGRISEHRGRVVARMAGMIDDPFAGKLLALRHPSPHPTIGRGRGADVDQHGRAVGRISERKRVGRDLALDPAMRGDGFRRRIGIDDQDREPRLGCHPQIGDQPRNVMRLPDHDSHNGVVLELGAGGFDGPHHKPGTGEELAVPMQRRRMVGQHHRLAICLHAPATEFGQKDRQQVEAVGRMTHEVAFEQHFRLDARAFLRQPRAHPEPGGIGEQVLIGVDGDVRLGLGDHSLAVGWIRRGAKVSGRGPHRARDRAPSCR